MDVSIPLIFVALFVVACFSLFLVYKYGIKEKSYEEALAEQRQQTNVLLGAKAKPKDRKSKKVAKKPKEKESKGKPSVPLDTETDESENVEPNIVDKPHVEFKEEPEEVPVKEVLQLPVKPKRVKKVRPILIRKENSPVRVDLTNVDTPIANHFEENHPKDDCELMRSNSRDEIFKQENVKDKVTKEKKISPDVMPPSRNKKEKLVKQPNNVTPAVNPIVEETVEEKKIETVAILAPANGVVLGNQSKEKKKKKSEIGYRHQLTAEKDILLNSVRKAELSKTEVQLLIDLLLNKQLEAPAVDDWSEGKSDPIQKLKKQLAEKEKLLAEEQEALAGAQAKLREVRAEQQSERSQLQQKVRALEEAVQSQQLDVQSANNRAQVGAQKLQQVQADLNSEIMKVRKFAEDNGKLQMQLQQMQEAENIMPKLRSDLEEFSAQNQQLHLELQKSVSEKEHQHQHFLVQMANLEKTLEQQNEVTRQLKESNQKLERNLEMAVRQQEDWSIENAKLKGALQQHYDEKLALEHALHQITEDLRVTKNENVESAKLIHQLKSDLQTLQEQISQVNGNTEDHKNQEVKILNLTNELSSVKNELSSVKNQLQQAEKKYKVELESSSKDIVEIREELEEQKAKNNELRTKNWKVMEALNAAESKNKSSSKSSDIDIKKLTQEVVSREQDSQKQFIQRLFPEVNALKAVTSEDWQAEFGKLIANYVSGLKNEIKQQTSSSPQKSAEVEKLQVQLQHYKSVIDDTEGMLNKLQSHIEKEEIKWRDQLQTKEGEIEQLKEKHSTQLREKVASLEQQLAQEINEKQRLLKEIKLLGSQRPQLDSTATIEKLSEEVNYLREQLRVEQTKNGDVGVSFKAQNNHSNSVNGPNFIEHCLSSSSSLASSVIEGLNKKPKNKKRKKKSTEC